MAKNWQYLVETAPTRAYRRMAKDKEKLLARYVPNAAFDGGSPPTYLYASGNLNRCNPKGVACIYFAEGPETARTEFDSYYREPLSELGYYARAKLKAILDLTDQATRDHFGLVETDFTRSYVTKVRRPHSIAGNRKSRCLSEIDHGPSFSVQCHAEKGSHRHEPGDLPEPGGCPRFTRNHGGQESGGKMAEVLITRRTSMPAPAADQRQPRSGKKLESTRLLPLNRLTTECTEHTE